MPLARCFPSAPWVQKAPSPKSSAGWGSCKRTELNARGPPEPQGARMATSTDCCLIKPPRYTRCGTMSAATNNRSQNGTRACKQAIHSHNWPERDPPTFPANQPGGPPIHYSRPVRCTLHRRDESAHSHTRPRGAHKDIVSHTATSSLLPGGISFVHTLPGSSGPGEGATCKSGIQHSTV